MCRFLRYCVSHCLRTAMTRLEEVNDEVSVGSSVRWLGYLSSVNLLVALCLGLYVRWEKTAEMVLLVLLVFALIVVGAACVVYYYFNMERLSVILLHPSFGFLLGLLCFHNSPAVESDIKERVSNSLLLSSVVLRTLWALLDRLFGCTRYRPAFLTTAERLELIGFATASTILHIQKSLNVMVLVVALATVIVALRMKALLALPNLVCFAVISSLFIWYQNNSTNPFAMACFFSQLICDPLLDVYFSGLSVTERWQPFLLWRGLWRRLSLLPLLVVQVTFIVLAVHNVIDQELVVMVIPGIAVCMLFWAICHMVFVITVWGFHSKLSDCQRVCSSQLSVRNRLDKIMASKGMRHFCLISERLVLFTLVSTVAVAALCWQVSAACTQFIINTSMKYPSPALFNCVPF